MIRDEEELEGALLLPVATHVGRRGATNIGIPLAVAAMPIGCFDYDDDVLVEEERRQQQQQAFCLPTERSPKDHESHERVGVARGQQMARIRNEEELEAIRQAQRKVYSQDYYAQLEANNANVRARQKDIADRHALQYAHQLRPPWHNNSSGDYDYDYELHLTNGDSSRVTAAINTVGATCKESQAKGDNSEDKTSGYKVGGYQVKEYQFGSSAYDTQEYGISEYNSVYD
jgi:hypothetical protein